MQRLTSGQIIQMERELLAMSEEILIEGLGTKQSLNKLENDQLHCDKLLFDVLMQRMGRSPDKLEYVLRWEEYRVECVWEWFAECVHRGKKKWAERALELYMNKVDSMGAAQTMFVCRGHAMIAYWLDGDMQAAEKWMIQALDATFPRWKEKEWANHRISSMELENMLALVQVRIEQRKQRRAQEVKETQESEAVRTDRELLERCRNYIEAHITDEEENAKIYSKYAWVTAELDGMEKEPEQVFLLCAEALERLRQSSIEYFMRPLLRKIMECQTVLQEWRERMGYQWSRETERYMQENHYREYLDSLQHLHEQFGESWLPEHSLFHNCCQKSYHLDFEIIRGERLARGMTQEMVSEGVYENPKEIAKIENRKSSPRGKRFTGLMDKLGLEKERRRGFLITDSFQVLELWKKIQGHGSRHEYEEIEPLLEELTGKLDMGWLENRRAVQWVQHMIAMNEAECPCEELLEKDWELLQKTYCLSMERMQTPPVVRVRKGKKIIYRAPFKNEANLINQIGILLRRTGKKEEAIRLLRWTIETFEKSKMKPRYRYYPCGLLWENIAKYECSAELSEKALRYELNCGKAGALGDNYLTLACALLDDSSNRESCKTMIRETYYLFELSKNYVNQKVVADYYQKKFDSRI